MTELELKFDKKLYSTDIRPKWCPGCGDFAMLKAVKDSLFDLQKDPSQTILIAGIGCSSKMSGSIGTYGLHGIHGRALPMATGVKLANHNLEVLAYGGDGDMLGIGMGHFMHACKRNLNMTLLIPNNQTYGLTTGQASPTSDKGYKTKTSPKGVFDEPMNPTLLALSAGASFVARTSSADNKMMSRIIKEAIHHEGMAVIEIHQFCITWNKINTPDYYAPRYFDVQETDLDISDKETALKIANTSGDKIPIGIIYKSNKPSFEKGNPALQGQSIVERRRRELIDVSEMFNDWK